MGDSEIARLSWKVYREHHGTIELMLANILETFKRNQKLIRTLIKEDSVLQFGYIDEEAMERWVVFDVKDWNVRSLNVGDDYKGSNRILYFVVYADPLNDLDLWLEIGPGDEMTRRKLFGMAHQNPTVFEGTQRNLDEWTQTYKHTLLSLEFYETSTQAKIEAEIRKNWNDFLENDLPRIDAALKAEDWIWEDSETSSE